MFFKWVYFGELGEVLFVPWIARRRLGRGAIGASPRLPDVRDVSRARPAAEPLGPVWNVFQHRYYIDDFYMRAIVRPVRDTLSAGVYWFNQNVLDGVVNGAASATKRSRGDTGSTETSSTVWSTAAGESAGDTGGLLQVHPIRQRPAVRGRSCSSGVIALAIIFIKVA